MSACYLAAFYHAAFPTERIDDHLPAPSDSHFLNRYALRRLERLRGDWLLGDSFPSGAVPALSAAVNVGLIGF